MPDDQSQNQDDGGTPPPGDNDQQERTFTQADIDRIVKERLAREQARFADYDDLKKAAGEYQKIKEAQLTETELLRKQLAEWQQKEADWNSERATWQLEQNEQLLKAEVRVQAAGLSFIDPDEAYLLADLGEVEAEDRAKGVKKALEALTKAKPHLIKTAGGPGSPPNEPKRSKADQDAAIDAYAEKYGIRRPPKQQ